MDYIAITYKIYDEEVQFIFMFGFCQFIFVCMYTRIIVAHPLIYVVRKNSAVNCGRI